MVNATATRQTGKRKAVFVLQGGSWREVKVGDQVNLVGGGSQQWFKVLPLRPRDRKDHPYRVRVGLGGRTMSWLVADFEILAVR